MDYPGIAVELLKSHSTRIETLPLEHVMARFIRDKFYTEATVRLLLTKGSFTRMLSTLIMRENDYDRDRITLLDYATSRAFSVDPNLPRYTSSDEQNSRIDRAIALEGRSTIVGQGMATHYAQTGGVLGLSSLIREVPIAVLGYGPAGILATHALRELGFTRVAVFERGKALGLWSYPFVAERTRNNPRTIIFFDEAMRAAPGGADEVVKFLRKFARSRDDINQGTITGVTPQPLAHTVHVQPKEGEPQALTFPIVINTLGVGKPKPVSDPFRMMTSASTADAGPRWQQTLTPEQVRRRRLLFIGLGNSTAEMLRQMYTFIDAGIDTDFRVFTHYPKDAVFNPSAVVVNSRDRKYRVFRDVSMPNLVDYQGDLPQSRSDYARALYSGRIVHDVRAWTRHGRYVTAVNASKRHLETVPIDQVYTLIGYRQEPLALSRLGCWTKRGVTQYDYDGEMLRYREGLRLPQLGYFGFGAILDAPWNPNAIVIPGMLHRLGDLMFGVIMRATEYQISVGKL